MQYKLQLYCEFFPWVLLQRPTSIVIKTFWSFVLVSLHREPLRFCVAVALMPMLKLALVSPVKPDLRHCSKCTTWYSFLFFLLQYDSCPFRKWRNQGNKLNLLQSLFEAYHTSFLQVGLQTAWIWLTYKNINKHFFRILGILQVFCFGMQDLVTVNCFKQNPFLWIANRL